MTTPADSDWSRWVPVLEKVLADLKTLNAYMRGEINYDDYHRQVGIANSLV